MHYEFLVEDESMEAFLKNLFPKIVKSSVTFKVHPFQGKLDLLKKLPDRLRGYKKWKKSNFIIVILLDRDKDDCITLKNNIENVVQRIGFITRSKVKVNDSYQILIRIAVEELEAWFFGDMAAVKQIYPKIPNNIDNKSGYRNPDDIKGGTWEALERILQRAGYYPSGLPKIEVAREISAVMVPQRNKSKSFQVFLKGIMELGKKT